MNIKGILLSVLMLLVMISSCENPLEDRVEELEYQLALYEQQQLLIDSLMNVLFSQQAIIDSLMVEHESYIDSISGEWIAQIITLNSMQLEIVDLLINAQDVTGTGEDYVRISNVQICWGAGQTNLNGSVKNFPVSFTEPPIVIMNPIENGQKIPSVEDVTLSTATFYINTPGLSSYNYQAIGYWL